MKTWGLGKILRLFVRIETYEIQAVLWSCLYFFFILAGYYVIRPLRDEMAVAAGVSNLPWLFTGTLLAMLLVNPLFSTLVVSLPRKRFVSISYRFFIFNLSIFYLLFISLSEDQGIWIGRIFYIWTSVFNLFVVSVFWGFMADIFAKQQGKRLFGFITAGGTLGGVAGSSLTWIISSRIEPVYLILIAILFIECSVRCMNRLCQWSAVSDTNSVALPGGNSKTAPLGQADVVPIGGNIFAGFTNVVRSPYMIGISIYMLLFTVTATFLYFQQAQIVEAGFIDRAARTAVFARIDLAVNVLTVFTQLFLTGRVIRILGVGLTLSLLPIISVVGFSSLGFYTVLPVLIVFQTLRRAGNFALAHPARETLYTVLSRENKYKAKTLIDTFVYRLGDQIGAWSYAGLMAMGLTVSGVAFIAVPISGLWCVVSIWLGISQGKQKMGA
jgi:AAA family ATP:ADP antiporter